MHMVYIQPGTHMLYIHTVRHTMLYMHAVRHTHAVHTYIQAHTCCTYILAGTHMVYIHTVRHTHAVHTDSQHTHGVYTCMQAKHPSYTYTYTHNKISTLKKNEGL